MDDLIVILLTLIIAAAGAIGQLKKKKKEMPGAPDEQKTGGDIWDMFTEEVFPEAASTETIPVSEELEEEYEEKYEPYINEQKYDFKADNEGGNIITKESKPETKSIKKRFTVKEDFSLRKAVIYSEILNRKYK